MSVVSMLKKYQVPIIIVATLIFVVLVVMYFRNRKKKEGFTYNQPVNTKYWPFHYYSFPYMNKHGGAWPPGMFSRLYYQSPTFHIGSGLSTDFRPGVQFNPTGWPRHRWIKQKGGYNTITNSDDYLHGAADYASTSLKF